jgi:hypothetical protein
MSEQLRPITTTVTFDNQMYEIAIKLNQNYPLEIEFMAKASLTNETWKHLVDESDLLFDLFNPKDFFVGMQKAVTANNIIEVSLD